MVDFVSKHGYDNCVETKDEIASDVVGNLPWVMNMGLLDPDLIENALKRLHIRTREYSHHAV